MVSSSARAHLVERDAAGARALISRDPRVLEVSAPILAVEDEGVDRLVVGEPR